MKLVKYIIINHFLFLWMIEIKLIFRFRLKRNFSRFIHPVSLLLVSDLAFLLMLTWFPYFVEDLICMLDVTSTRYTFMHDFQRVKSCILSSPSCWADDIYSGSPVLIVPQIRVFQESGVHLTWYLTTVAYKFEISEHIIVITCFSDTVTVSLLSHFTNCNTNSEVPALSWVCFTKYLCFLVFWKGYQYLGIYLIYQYLGFMGIGELDALNITRVTFKLIFVWAYWFAGHETCAVFQLPICFIHNLSHVAWSHPRIWITTMGWGDTLRQSGESEGMQWRAAIWQRISEEII